jgi:hypothetical protein
MSLREAAQQALETYDAHDPMAVVMEDLRTALAEPVQEPVGQLQEEVFGRGQVMWFRKPPNNAMLYTHPVDDTALLRQALEALVAAVSDDQPYIVRCNDVITALRERLGEKT